MSPKARHLAVVAVACKRRLDQTWKKKKRREKRKETKRTALQGKLQLYTAHYTKRTNTHSPLYIIAIKGHGGNYRELGGVAADIAA